MKIACISASNIPSGTANSIQAMKACQALAQLGHTVRLLVPGTPGQAEWQALAQHYGLRTPFEVNWLMADARWKRYDFSLQAVRQASEWGAQVVYTWALQAALLGLVADRTRPVLLEMHGPAEGRLGPWLLRLLMRLKGVRRLLPITRALSEILRRQAGRDFAPGECVLAPNGVDLERFRDLPSPVEARRMLGLPSGLTAGYTGHLYAGRGIGLLEKLAQEFPKVNFLWVGGLPDDVDAWRKRLEAQGLQNVTLVGFVKNYRLPLYQAAADVLLMPYERSIAGSSGGDSAAYASPMKMFEYMACRRAILSSDLPVVREVIGEQNAVLCPPDDLPAWSQALRGLLAEESLRQHLAEQAWQDVQQYTWEARALRSLEGLA